MLGAVEAFALVADLDAQAHELVDDAQDDPPSFARAPPRTRRARRIGNRRLSRGRYGASAPSIPASMWPVSESCTSLDTIDRSASTKALSEELPSQSASTAPVGS